MIASDLPGWVSSLGYTSVGALLFYASQVALQWRKHGSEAHTAAESARLGIEKHRDGLTVQMLEMAREELRAARAELTDMRIEMQERDREIDRLRRIELRVQSYEEALGHIEALVRAEVDGNREAAEHAARIYLARMTAMKLVAGAEANQEQVRRAAQRRIEGDMQ